MVTVENVPSYQLSPLHWGKTVYIEGAYRAEALAVNEMKAPKEMRKLYSFQRPRTTSTILAKIWTHATEYFATLKEGKTKVT